MGGAQLEFWLRRLQPEIQLIVTDYGEATLQRLADVFPEAHIQYHDLRHDGPLPADIHLFHRIDTELSDEEWRDLFDRYGSASVLLVAAQMLNLKRVLLELGHRPFMKRRGASSAGFLRTRGAFEALWQETHSAQPLRMHDLHAWALEPTRPLPPDEA